MGFASRDLITSGVALIFSTSAHKLRQKFNLAPRANDCPESKSGLRMMPCSLFLHWKSVKALWIDRTYKVQINESCSSEKF